MPTVLVVEDDEHMRALTTEVLQGAGHRVVVAGDASAALVQLLCEPVDLVLLDMSLPGPGGRGVLDAIRRNPALEALPVVVLTAGGPGRDLVTALSFGADDYLSKPFDIDELLARIGAHLRSYNRLRAAASAAAGLSRENILAICRGREWDVAFQPIRELADMQVVGFEALARFHNGRSPLEVFSAARVHGLDTELEIAAAVAAAEAAAALPEGCWLSINLSPKALLSPGDFGECARGHGRELVLELTEHEQVADYPALHAAAEALGSGVRISVDDAGSGYASLSHVLALHPAFVKLDRSWIHGISDDAPRRALVRGMRGIADETGSVLVAEGIERDEDLRVVSELGVELGQGFLLGHPSVLH